MAADNSDGIQGDSTLGAVRSRPVSDVWKFYMKLHDWRKAMCTICKIRWYKRPPESPLIETLNALLKEKLQEIIHTTQIC